MLCTRPHPCQPRRSFHSSSLSCAWLFSYGWIRPGAAGGGSSCRFAGLPDPRNAHEGNRQSRWRENPTAATEVYEPSSRGVNLAPCPTRMDVSSRSREFDVRFANPCLTCVVTRNCLSAGALRLRCGRLGHPIPTGIDLGQAPRPHRSRAPLWEVSTPLQTTGYLTRAHVFRPNAVTGRFIAPLPTAADATYRHALLRAPASPASRYGSRR